MSVAMLDAAIRRVPNFPKPGITFYDVTGVLVEPPAFTYCCETLANQVRASGANAIAATEARGFIFAAPVAVALGVPLLLARKKGKLPNPCTCQDFDLEYGSDTLCLQQLDLVAGRKVHLIDDLLATGGTLRAVINVLEGAGLTVAGISGVIGLPFLGYETKLDPHRCQTLIQYHKE